MQSELHAVRAASEFNTQHDAASACGDSRWPTGAACCSRASVRFARAPLRDRGYRIALEVPGRPVTALYAEELGEGPSLILLHGLGGSLFTWRHVVAALSRAHRVIALDLKGFGQSDKPFDEHYSAADQAALVSAFIRKRGLSGVTLVGHSFGGVVALRTALDFAREPGVIARLVVMDTPALQQDLSDGDWFFSVPGLPYAAMAVTPPEFMTRMMLRLVSAPGRVVPESDVRGYAAPFYDLGSRHAFIATGQSIIDTNGPKMGRAYREHRAAERSSSGAGATASCRLPPAAGWRMCCPMRGSRFSTSAIIFRRTRCRTLCCRRCFRSSATEQPSEDRRHLFGAAPELRHSEGWISMTVRALDVRHRPARPARPQRAPAVGGPQGSRVQGGRGANFFRVTRGHVLLAGPRTARAVPEYERQYMTVVELRSQYGSRSDARPISRPRRLHRRGPARVGRLRPLHPALGHHAAPLRRRGGPMVRSGLARRGHAR